MNAEHIKILTENALDQLAADLERGSSDSLRRYLAAMAYFHHYSFRNLMLILSQNPDASRVAGFRAWKKLGRYVKKGEKGLVITAPMVLKRSDDEAQPGEQDTQHKEQDPGGMLRFRGVYVFDVSQTDGDPLADLGQVQGEPGEFTQRLKEAITHKGIELVVEEMDVGTHGYSTGGRIAICPGLSPAEEFSVLVHELAHELLHRDGDRPETRRVRELEAESVAFAVTHGVGLSPGTAASDYIQLYGGDKVALLKSLERVRTAATTILSAITSTHLSGTDARSAA